MILKGNMTANSGRRSDDSLALSVVRNLRPANRYRQTLRAPVLHRIGL